MESIFPEIKIVDLSHAKTVARWMLHVGMHEPLIPQIPVEPVEDRFVMNDAVYAHSAGWDDGGNYFYIEK